MSPVEAAVKSVHRAIGSFHPGTMPRLSRAHYRRELAAWAFLPVMMGVVEGGVISVIAKNAFDGHVGDPALNFAVAVLAGAPAFANITSFFWAALSHGRHKIRFLFGLQTAAAVLITLIALSPRNALGLVLLTLCVVGARMCWSGVITIRSTVWRANYPRNARANMAGKLATVQAIIMSSAGLLTGILMAWNDESFRILYPLAAVIGMIGVWIYRTMRVRGHRAMLLAEQSDGSQRSGFNPFSLWHILREDRDYRHFMICMFILGTGNMMVMAPLVIMLRDVFGMGYLMGILISTSIPIILMPLSIPIWSRLLDNVHIIRFRAIHSWTFVVAACAWLAAALTVQPALLWVAAVLKGIAFGGGVLGWNLGHHDFAPRHKVSQYMGVHVTLTGIRGLLAPMLAVGIYEMLNATKDGRGAWVFGVCLLLNIIGTAGFMIMRKRFSGPGGKSDFGEEGPPLQPPAAG